MTDSKIAPLPLFKFFLEHSSTAAGIRIVATDVDGTLTRDGELTGEALAAIEALTGAGVEVVPVSGRPAGEVLGLCRYLPGVRKGIAENGLISVVPDEPLSFIGAPTNVTRLREIGEALNADHAAGLRLAGDAFCRVADVAYERDGRDVPELMRLRTAAKGQGAFLVWSSVHVHLAERIPDKGQGLLSMLEQWGASPSTVATIGDAPNDSGLFTPHRFGLTVGTADVVAQADAFPHLPQMVTAGRELDGFLELARGLLKSRGVQTTTH